MLLSDYIFFSMFAIMNSYMLLNVNKKLTTFKRKLLQLFWHFQCIEGAAKSIISWSNIKQFIAILFEPKPVTFQDHLMACLHDLNGLHGAIILYFLGIVFREIIFFQNCKILFKIFFLPFSLCLVKYPYAHSRYQ